MAALIPVAGDGRLFTSWAEFLSGKAKLGAREHLGRIPRRLPILLISGTRDPVGENGRGVRRLLSMYQAAGLECVRMKLYEDARHELANETIRDEVTADVIAWLDETVRQTKAVAGSI